jgi:hypothetical protein
MASRTRAERGAGRCAPPVHRRRIIRVVESPTATTGVRPMKRPIPLAVLTATLLAGCATGPKLSTTEKLALYHDHAGEPVKDFRYFGTLNGWSPLGDGALAVWTKPREAYLLELSGRCPDLEYAMAIHITQFGNRVSARFDDVLPLGAGTSSIKIPCRIQTIRPLDVKALRASEKELREASAVERETGS